MLTFWLAVLWFSAFLVGLIAGFFWAKWAIKWAAMRGYLKLYARRPESDVLRKIWPGDA